ncbi:MAG TPA: hypothetical protein VLS53_02700 [Candidatus Dormibacteraeota bacterium]|nr:hypothetical protein [Candidatus Dormibacteraeota bacterium]
MDHILCELKQVLDDNDPALAKLRENIYVTYASLTVDVTVNEGFTPTLSALGGGTRSLSVGGQVSGQQHRDMTQTFTLLLDPGYADPSLYPNFNKAKADACPKKDPLQTNSSRGIHGDLGLKEVIAAGLMQVLPADFILPLPAPDDHSGSAVQLSSSLVPNFGTTIDFALTYGLNGGPNWTLTHFTGPGTSWLDWSRTAKDTLVISFASAGPRALPDAIPRANRRPLPGNLSPIEEAGKVAQDNVTRMILQRILPR